MTIDFSKLYTCYPLKKENAFPHVYEVRLLFWDGDKRCTVEHQGQKYNFKIGYLSDVPDCADDENFLCSKLGRTGWLQFLNTVPEQDTDNENTVFV